MEDLSQQLKQAIISNDGEEPPSQATPKPWFIPPPTDRKNAQWSGYCITDNWCLKYGQNLGLGHIKNPGWLAMLALTHIKHWTGIKTLRYEMGYMPVDEPQIPMFTILVIFGTRPGEVALPTQEQLDKIIQVMGERPKWYVQAELW